MKSPGLLVLVSCELSQQDDCHPDLSLLSFQEQRVVWKTFWWPNLIYSRHLYQSPQLNHSARHLHPQYALFPQPITFHLTKRKIQKNQVCLLPIRMNYLVTFISLMILHLHGRKCTFGVFTSNSRLCRNLV
jgi:hypothetical protein